MLTLSRKVLIGALAAAALTAGSLLAVAPAQAGIILFEHENYNAKVGQALNIGSGHRSSLPGFNDKTTSFKISGKYTVRLFEHEDYRGCSSPIWSGSKSDLRNQKLCSTGKNWSDKASSVK